MQYSACQTSRTRSKEGLVGRQGVSISATASDVLATLGSLIREHRVRGAMTQAEVAARAGVSTRTVAAIEAGSPSTAVGNVLNVAIVVGIPLFSTDDADEHARMRVRSERNALLPKRVRLPARDSDGLDF